MRAAGQPGSLVLNLISKASRSGAQVELEGNVKEKRWLVTHQLKVKSSIQRPLTEDHSAGRKGSVKEEHAISVSFKAR